MRAKIEHLWPMIYAKKMNPDKLIGLEFILGIVAKSRGIDVDWATFAVAANKTQIRNWQKDTDGIKASLANLVFERTSALGSQLDSKVTSGGSKDPHKGQRRPNQGLSRGMEGVSTEWTRKLAGEVGDMLRVVTIEWWASKHRFIQVEKEDASLVGKTRAAEMLVAEFTLQLEALGSLELPKGTQGSEDESTFRAEHLTQFKWTFLIRSRVDYLTCRIMPSQERAWSV